LEALNAKTIEYNGEMYSEYEISQMQRAAERKVRAAKRTYLAEDAAGVDTSASAVKLKQARQQLSQFIKDTGAYPFDSSARTSVAGFGRSAASKAAWKYRKDTPTAVLNRNKDITYRKVSESGVKVISQPVYEKIVRPIIKAGGAVFRGGEEVEKHLDLVNANASTLNDMIFLRENPTTSDVLEEAHHFWQNKKGLNDDKPALRTVLNEIDAKEYLLSVTEKYKIPLEEVELTRKQLSMYQEMLKELGGGKS
jgi:hypothetical protein